MRKKLHIKENLETQMIEVYNQAMQEFEKGDAIYAGENLVKQNYYFTVSMGTKGSFNVCIWLFFPGYYANVINDLERFIVKYKNHKNLDYAYYLLALCHYDQIVDEKDLNEILQSKIF